MSDYDSLHGPNAIGKPVRMLARSETYRPFHRGRFVSAVLAETEQA